MLTWFQHLWHFSLLSYFTAWRVLVCLCFRLTWYNMTWLFSSIFFLLFSLQHTILLKSWLYINQSNNDDHKSSCKQLSGLVIVHSNGTDFFHEIQVETRSTIQTVSFYGFTDWVPVMCIYQWTLNGNCNVIHRKETLWCNITFSFNRCYHNLILYNANRVVNEAKI